MLVTIRISIAGMPEDSRSASGRRDWVWPEESFYAMKTPDIQKTLVLQDSESRVTLSKRDFAALTKALNGPFKPNSALKGALAEAAGKVRRA